MRKPEGMRLLGRPRRICQYNIKMDLQEMGRRGTDWIRLADDMDEWRDFVNTVMDLCVPHNAGNLLIN